MVVKEVGMISRRAKIIPSSPIRKLYPYANIAKERGIKVYHLNIGQPDVPTPKEILNGIRGFRCLQILQENMTYI